MAHVFWSLLGLVIGDLLKCHVGAFGLRSTQEAVASDLEVSWSV